MNQGNVVGRGPQLWIRVQWARGPPDISEVTAFHAASIDPQPYGEQHVLLPAHLTGDVVTEMRGRLLGYAHDPAVRRLVVDCGEVEEFAPYAMTVLIAATRAARSHGGQLEMVHPNPLISEALDRLGLHKVLTVIGDDVPPRPRGDLR